MTGPASRMSPGEPYFGSLGGSHSARGTGANCFRRFSKGAVARYPIAVTVNLPDNGARCRAVADPEYGPMGAIVRGGRADPEAAKLVWSVVRILRGDLP